nr:hypothetical protein [Tanacetum cinerariifolium]
MDQEKIRKWRHNEIIGGLFRENKKNRFPRRHVAGERLCWPRAPVTFMNVEEWGIFLVTVPMFRRTNAAGGVQNRPAEDGRVHVVEPRAREALKKGGGDGRLYSESMPELDSAKMIIDAGISDNIFSSKLRSNACLRLEDLAKEGDSPVDSFPWFDPSQ